MRNHQIQNHIASRLMAAESVTMSCAACLFGTLRVSFWGYWAWWRKKSVCETC